jgi:hypothetical protein
MKLVLICLLLIGSVAAFAPLVPLRGAATRTVKLEYKVTLKRLDGSETVTLAFTLTLDPARRHFIGNTSQHTLIKRSSH